MDDYISRQAVVDVICDMHIGGKDGVANALPNTYVADIREIIEQIDSLPSLDAVEVVRCKDCEYFDIGTDEDGKPFFKCLGWVYGGTSEDDFCSHGERKDGSID